MIFNRLFGMRVDMHSAHSVRGLLIGAAAMLSSIALAGPQSYATTTQTIRAGIVILASSGASGAPHALYNFDANIGIKPAGWTLVNPLAPTRVNTFVNSRWPSSSVGNRISKREAAYWEVFPSTATDAQLANFDFLLLDPVGVTSLAPIERERLRRFVDHGGILWIDPGAIQGPGQLDPGNNFPAPFEIQSAPSGNYAQLSNFTHPLLSRPELLSTQDVSLLNTGIGGAFMWDLQDPLLTSPGLPNGLLGNYSDVEGDYSRILPVAVVADGVAGGTNGSTTIGVMQMGSGYVIVTARGASMKLNRVNDGTLSYSTNTQYEGENPALMTDGLAVAKLVTNMISLGAQYRMQSSDARHTNSVSIDLGGPLLQRMADQSVTFQSANVGGPVNYGAVVFQGITIVSTSNGSTGFLAAYRVDPNSALTGNGDPGEAIPSNPGSGADLLWVSPTIPGPLSAPVLVEVPNPAGGTLAGQNRVIEEVLVTDGQGNVHAYNPISRLPNGLLDTSKRVELWSEAAGGTGPNSNGGVAPPADSGAAVTGLTPPNPPTVQEGLAFIADTVAVNAQNHGRIWVINLATGQRMNYGSGDWFMGGEDGNPLSEPPFTASATVGYIPIFDNSGGLDRVVYAPWTGDSTNGAPGFCSLWVGARGEKATASLGTNQLIVLTRASQQGMTIYAPSGADPLGIHLTVLDQSSNPLPTSEASGFFTGAPQSLGQGSGVAFTLTGNGQTYFNNLLANGGTINVRIDYTIDWTNSTTVDATGVLAHVERGRIQLPDQVGNTTRFLTGPLALSPAGTVYIAASGGGTAGLFGFQEQGRGLFICNNRFELYPKYQFATQGAGLDTELSTVGDNDPIAVLMSPQYLNQLITNWGIVGAPAIRNGQVIITVSAAKGSLVPCTILMALESEPQPTQFTLPSLPDGTVLVQADLVRSTELGTGTADVPAVLPTNAYSYDPTTHLVTISNLMTGQNGAIQQCLSLSQRLWERSPGQSDVAIDPDNQTGASVYSPLLWYTVLNGYSAKTGPVITGNSVYVGGSSGVVSILNGAPGNGQPIVNQGLLYAFKANISPNDPSFVTDIDIPPGYNTTEMQPTNSANARWSKQLLQLTAILNPVTNQYTFTGNPDVEWPQFSTTGGLSAYIARLSQTTLQGSTQVVGFAAGDGSLVAQGDGGLYTFDRADFVVADSGRISLFDPSGNPLWSTTSYADTGAGATGGAATVHQLVRPTRAYRLNQTDLLVVDSGASTVVRMNMSGLEIRAINAIALDPKLTPNGYTAGEPTSLNNPRDATTFSSLEAITPTSSVTLGDGESNPGYEIWTHYLIADTGNHRIVELVDRYAYNPNNQSTGSVVTINGVPQLGVLVWHSPAVVTNKKYDYNSVTRSLVPTGSGGTKFVYIASVGTVTPTQADLGITSGGPTAQRDTVGSGGILIFDPTQPGPLVINQLSIPFNIPANVLWQENQATGVGAFTAPAQSPSVIPMSNVSSVSTFVTTVDGTPTGAPAIDIMIACGSGVYEALYDPNSTGPPSNTLTVSWMVPNQVYRVMRLANGFPTTANPQALAASYAERLSPSDVVIVNGYNGTTRGGSTFVGEVVQLASGAFNVNSLNLGFTTNSITFQLPPIQGARSLIQPVFADRR
jgi:hypothetical protein